MSELKLRHHGLEPFLAQLPQDTNDDAGVTIQIQANLSHINLRGSPENLEFVRAATNLLGQELPVIANTMTLGKLRIYWLGPNEWLILTSVDGSPKLVTQLREALQGQHASVTELSSGTGNNAHHWAHTCEMYWQRAAHWIFIRPSSK